MNPGFSVSETFSLNAPAAADFGDQLVHAIHQHTHWRYTCDAAANGYFLHPVFREMVVRNSFVPVISVSVLSMDGQFFLELKGRPVLSVRIFMGFWIGFLLLGSLPISGWERIVPLGMLLLGYLLCKIATKTTFRSIVTAIKKDFSQRQG